MSALLLSRPPRPGLALLALCWLGGASPLPASTWTWAGATGPWLEPNNWSPASVPLSDATIFIDNGGVAQLAAPTAHAGGRLVGVGTSSGLQISNGGRLEIQTGGLLGWGGTGLIDDARADAPESTVAGFLTIQNHGIANFDLTRIANGQVLVTGPGSLLRAVKAGGAGQLNVGTSGTGTLTVAALAVVTADILGVGSESDNTGTGFVTVDQATLNTTLDASFGNAVGLTGNGTLTLRNVAAVTIGGTGQGRLNLAVFAGSTGNLEIGVPGDGLSGGALNAGTIAFGAGTGAINVRTGNFTLSAAVLGTGTISKAGTGVMTVTNNIASTVSISFTAGQIAFGDGSTSGDYAGSITTPAGGSVQFNPVGAQTSAIILNGAGNFTKSGPGQLVLTNPQAYTGATFVTAGQLSLAASSSRPLLADAPESSGALTSTFSVNVDNSGTLNPATSPPAVLELVGAGASVNASQNSSGVGLTVGNSNKGTLNILNGATISNVIAQVGVFSGSNGGVLLDAGTWNSQDQLTIGSSGTGVGTLQNGGQLLTQALVRLGGSSGGNGTLNVSGPTSLVRVGATGAGELRVGDAGTGTVNLSGGATMNSTANIATSSTATGTVTVSGTGTVWNCPGLGIGPTGNGTVIVEDGGLVNAAGTQIQIARNNLSTGRLRIGSGALPGPVNASSILFGRNGTTGGNSTLEFNHSGPFTFTLPVSGIRGTLLKNGSGTTTVTGALTYTGGTTVNAGTLLLATGATFMTTLAVNSGGILALGGNTYGTTTCTSTIAAGGTVLGPGTLRGTVINNGALFVNGAGTLAFTGIVTNNGRLTLANGGTISSTGASFTNAAGGVIEVLGGTFTPPPGFVNNGLIYNASIVQIAAATLAGGVATFTVHGVTGRSYQLQRSTALESEVFVNLGAAQPGATGSPLLFSDQNASGAKGFYRVVAGP